LARGMTARMHKQVLFKGISGVLFAGLAATAAFAQSQILPNKFASWSGQSVVDWSGPASAVPGPVLKEAGQGGAEYEHYASGNKQVTVKLETYHDPSGAYEAYTALLNGSMHPSVVWTPSAVSGDQLIALIGNFILTVYKQQNASIADLQQLVKTVQKQADQTPFPPIRQYLPEGFSDGTQRYAQGPAGYEAALKALHQEEFTPLAPEIGFPTAEVMLAQYRSRADSGSVLLIDYPTPQVAEQRLHHLETVLPASLKNTESAITRRGSLLTIVIGASSPQYAGTLRDAVQYQTQVTWNEGHHVLTDPPWLVIVSRIFYATGVFLVVAIVLGVAFGGVRVLTKRFFPGKVFDRPQSIEVLQLGLSGKRINPEDFYSR
jgi:hypothetical protein